MYNSVFFIYSELYNHHYLISGYCHHRENFETPHTLADTYYIPFVTSLIYPLIYFWFL